MRSIGSLGSFAGAAGVDAVAGLGDGVGCWAKVVLGETRKMKSSTTVALRLNILMLLGFVGQTFLSVHSLNFQLNWEIASGF